MEELVCAECGSEDLRLVTKLEDGRRRIACNDCQHEWVRGEATIVPKPVDTFATAKARFADSATVEPGRAARVEALKTVFLRCLLYTSDAADE